MNLRISDPKIEELAQQLAAQTGEDPTVAVIRALEESLQRRAGQPPFSEDAKVAEILAIAERATGLQGEGKTGRELINELYDENGLPV
ncbi:MAG: type II toxin-antitoxin system VapB family antitoxin [Rhizomicrobium sp.]|nr:type II toxin-antitoxin system VapB family antitoxin [Rhizomicrobium sp.]